MLDNKRILITGGTGTLGKVLVRRLLTNEMGKPRKIIVFSRDEAKQHFMRLDYMKKRASTDEVIYHNLDQTSSSASAMCAISPVLPALCRMWTWSLTLRRSNKCLPVSISLTRR